MTATGVDPAHGARLVVVTADTRWSRWQQRCVERLRALDGVQWVGWSVLAAAAQAPPDAPWRVLLRVERARFAEAGDPDTMLDAPHGAPAPWHGAVADDGRTAHGGVRPDDATLEAWRSLAADVVVWLCAAPPRAGLAALARWGVWVLSVDLRCADDAAAGSQAVLAAPHLCETALWDYAPTPPRCLYRSTGAAATNSLALTRRRALAKAESFMARCAASLLACGSLPVMPQMADQGRAPPPQSAPPPSGWRLGTAMAARVAANRWQRLRALDQWQIAYTLQPSLPWDDLRGWSFLVPPRECFWADPMPLHHEGRHLIFFEQLPYRGKRGVLLAQALHADGRPDGAPQPVLAADIHLSYPFVFRADGALFMVPETAAWRQVRLYRCAALPGQWELDSVLLEGVNAVDATLHRGTDGRWWMWVSVVEEGAERGEELHLYHAAELRGPWRAHAHNPLVSDIRCARPAGPLRQTAHGLLRPAQDSAAAYGDHLVWRRIDRLDEHGYAESTVGELRPRGRRAWRRMHTVAQDGALRVVDVMVRRGRAW